MEGKGRGEGGRVAVVVCGGVDESASLSFVVQMLLATVMAERPCDWSAGLNCKVHFRLMAAAARL